MTNYGTCAILALPKMPERQLRFLLALETFTIGEDGRREAGTGLLASTAGLSVKTAIRARRELAASGAIDYLRGNGKGHLSTYRMKVPADVVPLPDPGKVPSDTDHLSSLGKVPSDTDHLSSPERYPNGPRKGTQTGLVKVPTRNAATSGNASGALEPSALEPSALNQKARTHDREAERTRNRARGAARNPRLILAGLGATETEIDFMIARIKADPGIPHTAKWLLARIGEGKGDELLASARLAIAAQDDLKSRAHP